MTDYGLTAAGFRRKRLDEIKAEIEAEINTLLGPMDLRADSLLGQMVGIFSKASSDIWQEAENVYYSMYPATAEGTSLDNAVDLIAIVRLPATRTSVTVLASGNESIAVPAESIVKVSETGELFSNPLAGIITQSNALKVIFNVSTVTADVDYTVTLNSNNYTFHSGLSPASDGSDIAAGLIDEINTNLDGVTATALTGGQFELTPDDDETPFSTYPGSRLAVVSRSSPIVFEALNTGPVLALALTVDAIVTPISGWNGVTNITDGTTGRDMESDQDLRLRRVQSLRILGAASAEAIQARLRQDVANVTDAFVFENRLPTTEDGRPPHSFEVVIVGGDDQEIAQKIWEIKAAGIQTHGTTTEVIIDSNGFEQEIKFTRPDPVYVWINVDLSVLSGVTIPDSVLDDIKDAILEKGLEFGVGQDVIYQQFFSPVYQIAASYIDSVAITTATSATAEGPAGAYTAANVAVDEVEASSFALARINVET